MNKEKIDEQVLLIMKDFNFKQIHEVMKHLNIKYKIDSREVILSEAQLKSVALKCLNEVIASRESTAHASWLGFEAEKIGDLIELRYVLQKVNPLKTFLGAQQASKKKGSR